LGRNRKPASLRFFPAVIGMRRAGKTTFLYQCLAARLAEGVARERLVYFPLQGAAPEFPKALKVLMAEGTPPRGANMPEGIELVPVWRWLLNPQMT